jgi:hypothetical protein
MFTDVEVKCIECGRSIILRVPTKGFLQWRQGKKIQDALPMIEEGKHELLMSRICEDCWDELYPDEEMALI